MIDSIKTGVLIISHGSPLSDANETFSQLVSGVAARLPSSIVLPAFFSLASPTIPEQVDRLVREGVRKILLLPYFLHNGQHVTRDIPEQIEKCRLKHPDAKIELLSTLQGEPMVEDILVDRLASTGLNSAERPTSGKEIENMSFSIIDKRLSLTGFSPDESKIIKRIIHATADFSFAESMQIHPHAVQNGIAALRKRKPVICDVRMVAAGITNTDSEVLCSISDPDVIKKSKAQKTTRARVAMEKLAPHFDGAIVAVGNAPTALFALLDIVSRGGPRPALVTGIPVGFVGAYESKQALMESDLCYITNTCNRGGSSVVAAVINAINLLAKNGGSNE